MSRSHIKTIPGCRSVSAAAVAASVAAVVAASAAAVAGRAASAVDAG